MGSFNALLGLNVLFQESQEVLKCIEREFKLVALLMLRHSSLLLRSLSSEWNQGCNGGGKEGDSVRLILGEADASQIFLDPKTITIYTLPSFYYSVLN